LTATANRLSRLRLSQRDRFQQFIRAAKQGIPRFHRTAAKARRIGGDEMALTVLAHNLSAKMLHANLKTPAARRTFLDEIGRHRSTSYRQTAIQQLNA
jgi:hypothetical protein